jgi:hypothetical protein
MVSMLIALGSDLADQTPASRAGRDIDPVVATESCRDPARDTDPALESTASTTEAAPAAPTAHREPAGKPRPSRRPTWPPPAELVS